MTPPRPIEILRVAGSHADCGRAIGEFWGERIREGAGALALQLPHGATMEDRFALAERYRAVTAEEFPWIIEEIDGIATGAGIDPITAFAMTIEEIWNEEALTQGRCSDLVAGPPSTTDGRMLVAHNNDLGADAEEEFLAVEISVPGEPVTLGIGGWPWLSVGFNGAGLAFTGNELTPNDEVIGIPRQLQFRAMLRESTVGDAVRIGLHPRRASSYNNIVIGAHEVANIEGSATDAEITTLGHGGWLAHTNHYACDRMLPREGDPAYAKRSATRLHRAQALLSAAAPGSVDEDVLRVMLSDHENAPDSLCRHPEGDDTTKTVLWCIADPAGNRVTFGRGNPCDSNAQIYTFPEA